MANQELDRYIESERAKGRDNDSIHSSLVANGWDTIVAHRAVYSISSDKPKDRPVHGPANVMLTIGIIIILTTILTYIGTSWHELSAIARFLFVAIPNIVLFVIAWTLKGNDDTDHIKDGLAATALLIMPVTLGVFIYQFRINTEGGYWLCAISTLISLPFYLYHLFVSKKHYASLLVLTGSIASFVFVYGSDSLHLYQQSFLVALVGFLLLLSTTFSKKHFSDKNLALMEVAASLLFCFSIPNLFSDGASALFGPTSNNVIAFSTSVLGGGVLIAIAGMLGKLLTPISRLEYWNQRLLVVFAIIVMFFSLIGAGGDTTVYALISIALAIVITLLGTIFDIKTLYYGGIIGGTINLLTILFGNVDKISVLILMLIIGFGAILLSIVLATRKNKKANSAFEKSGFRGWGLISDQELSKLPLNTSWDNPSTFTIIMRIVLIYIAVWIFSAVISGIFASAVVPRIDNSYPVNTTFLQDRV